MLGFPASIRERLDLGVQPLKSRRAMLETLVRHLSMIRLTIAGCAIFALFGCTGLINTSGEGNLTPQQQLARQKWVDEALPAIRKATCDGCHAGSVAGVAFLAGSSDLDIRTSLLGFTPDVVDLNAPASSRILTKGVHSGPALLADQASSILDWIQAEQAAAATMTGSGTTLLVTPQFTPQLCTSGIAGDPTCPINYVPLDSLGLTGAKIQMLVQALDNNDIYVTDLYVAPSTGGVYIEHPLFVSYPAMGQPIPDSIDRFFDVKLNVPMASSVPTCPSSSCGTIGGGTAAFIGFPPTNQLAIEFKVVSPFVASGGTGGTGGGGCKRVDSFMTNAEPVMTASYTGAATGCATCHMGQNANATSAMDITGIDTTDMTMLTNACNQVRTRVNFQMIPQSGVLLAPEMGQDAAHPFKLSSTEYTSFSNGETKWIQDEQVAGP